jgi:hypothetical protein
MSRSFGCRNEGPAHGKRAPARRAALFVRFASDASDQRRPFLAATMARSLQSARIDLPSATQDQRRSELSRRRSRVRVPSLPPSTPASPPSAEWLSRNLTARRSDDLNAVGLGDWPHHPAEARGAPQAGRRRSLSAVGSWFPT